ncbi:MAG: DMT family transporter [Candidatus Kariarchaeaceae archaeon]
MTTTPSRNSISIDFAIKAAIIIFFWATPPLVSKVFVGTQSSFSGLFFGFLRYLLGSLSLFILITLRGNIKQVIIVSKQHILGVIICACWLILMIVGQNFSIYFILGSSSSVLLNFNPVIVYLFAPLLFIDEKYSKLQSLAVIISTVGIFLVFLAALDLLAVNFNDFLLGNALGLLSGVAWAGYTLTLRKIFSDESSEEVTSIILFLAAIILFLISSFVEQYPPIESYSIDSIIGLIIIGVGAAGIAFTLYLQLIQKYGATQSANIQFLIPIVSLILAWIFLGEFSILAIGGGILCAVGVALVTKEPKNS